MFLIDPAFIVRHDVAPSLSWVGTPDYASTCSLSWAAGADAHAPTFADDLEACACVLLCLARGSLPWSVDIPFFASGNAWSVDQMAQMAEAKEEALAGLWQELPEWFKRLVQYARALAYGQRIDVDEVMHILAR